MRRIGSAVSLDPKTDFFNGIGAKRPKPPR